MFALSSPTLFSSLIFLISFHVSSFFLPTLLPAWQNESYFCRADGGYFSGAVNKLILQMRRQRIITYNRDINDRQALHLQQMINCRTQPFLLSPIRDSVKVNAITWWNLKQSKQSDPQHVKKWELSCIWSVVMHTFSHLIAKQPCCSS